MSRRLWGGGNTSPLKTIAWEARVGGKLVGLVNIIGFRTAGH